MINGEILVHHGRLVLAGWHELKLTESHEFVVPVGQPAITDHDRQDFMARRAALEREVDRALMAAGKAADND